MTLMHSITSKNKTEVLEICSPVKEFVIDSNSCSGCKLCEMICSLRKRGSFNPKKAFIKIIKNSKYKVYLPVFKLSCDHCEGVPACADICPTKSILYTDEETAVLEINKAGKFPVLFIKGE